MPLLSGLLRWHENAEKRRREKSGFVRVPGLLATACRPLATVGVLSSGSVLFSTPSLLEIYVAARHVPHRNDTTIPWKRKPPNNLHADGLTDIDVEEDEDNLKASSLVVLSTGVVEQVGTEARATGGDNGASLVNRKRKEQKQNSEAIAARPTKSRGLGQKIASYFGQQEDQRQARTTANPSETSRDMLATVAGGTLAVILNERLQELQRGYVHSLGGTEEDLAKQIEYLGFVQAANSEAHAVIKTQAEDLERNLRTSIAGMDNLQGSFAGFSASLLAALDGLKALNGAKLYRSTDGPTSNIRIVPIEWKDIGGDEVNWEFPFQQGGSAMKTSAALKTVQYVQIPKNRLDAARPWRSYYRVAMDVSEAGVQEQVDTEWERQVSLVNDRALFDAMCRHGLDVSASLGLDVTNKKIASGGKSHPWNAVFNDEAEFEALFGAENEFAEQIQNHGTEIRIPLITKCTPHHANQKVDPCNHHLLSRRQVAWPVADVSDALKDERERDILFKTSIKKPQVSEGRRIQVQCAAPTQDEVSEFQVFRRVFVEFWRRDP
ncbi:unnamed protein product [Amoebophrya sp. A25]|nr:unnamed protein product [Amoebophrya sp. A25]|eukprot:GSA25T00018265001.1